MESKEPLRLRGSCKNPQSGVLPKSGVLSLLACADEGGQAGEFLQRNGLLSRALNSERTL